MTGTLGARVSITIKATDGRSDKTSKRYTACN
jgi:hypothetical protein